MLVRLGGTVTGVAALPSGVKPLVLNPDKTFNLSHVYADDVRDQQGNVLAYPVVVTFVDDDQGSGNAAAAVTVTARDVMTPVLMLVSVIV